VIGHELPAAVEQIQLGLLAAGTIEQLAFLDFDHRQPAPHGVDAVILPGEFLLLRQKFFPRDQPMLTRDNRGMRDVVRGHVRSP
jgi:hypothetical protein